MRAFTLLLVVLSAQLGACFRVTATPAACRISAHPRCAVTLLAKKAAKGKETLVVLLEPVKGIGKKGEVVSVKPAYAQNVLLAKGLGKVASPDVLKEIEKADAEAAAAAAAAKQEAKDIAAKIESAFGDEGVFIGAPQPMHAQPHRPAFPHRPRGALLGQGGLYIRTKLP